MDIIIDFDTAIVPEDKLESINSRLDTFDIFRKYIPGKVVLGKPFNSPLRKDRNPSCVIFRMKSANVCLYKDHATGEKFNIFNFVMKAFNLSYGQAIDMIYNDFFLSGNDVLRPIQRQENIVVTENTAIQRKGVISIDRNPFSITDVDFWSKYNISIEILNTYQVIAAKAVYFNDTIIRRYKKNSPIYAYTFDGGLYKIYCPRENKGNRWLTNASSDVIQGYKQLNKNSDLVIVTKSLKDVMTLRSLGYDAISLQAESNVLTKSLVEEMKSRFKEVIVLYDNDSTGMKCSQIIKEKHNLKTVFIPYSSFHF